MHVCDGTSDDVCIMEGNSTPEYHALDEDIVIFRRLSLLRSLQAFARVPLVWLWNGACSESFHIKASQALVKQYDIMRSRVVVGVMRESSRLKPWVRGPMTSSMIA